MAAQIVAHAGADRFRHGVEITQHVTDRLAGNLRIVLGEIVQIGDIGLMMPVVVDLHRFRIDMRFQRRHRVGEGRQHERAGGGGRGRGGLREGEARGRCNGSDTCGGKHEMAPG